MTAENPGRLLGLFAQRCRLPAAAVEEDDTASGEDEEGDRQKRGRLQGERKREEAAWGEYREGLPLSMSAASPKHLLVLSQLYEHITFHAPCSHRNT